MSFKSNRTPLIILGITALLGTRLMFWFFEDPEGPNLLIVFVMALPVYLVSLAPALFGFSVTNFNRLLVAVTIQAVLLVGIYFLL